MKINFQQRRHNDIDDMVPVCKFEFFVTMPRAIETQEEGVRCILAQIETMLGTARENLPRAEIFVDGKQLPKEAEKGGKKV